MLSRRGLITSGLATMALWPLGCGSSANHPGRLSGRNGRYPPYHLFFVLGGGIDTVFTADPKTRGEVEQAVDIPYAPGEIIEVGDLRLGPHLKSLSRWAPQMAVIRGVQTSTVSHGPGLSQLHRMHLGASSHDTRPSLLEIIGAQRSDEQPFPVVSFNTLPVTRSPGHLSEKMLFGRLMELDHDQSELVTKTLRRQADTLAGSRSGRELATAERLRDTARLLMKLRTVPKFEEVKWSDDPGAQDYARQLQQSIYIFENDLALCSQLINYEWDTHSDNTAEQGRLAAKVFPMLDRFLEELSKRRSSRGVLADHTRIILASELGRHPVLNAGLGKHHFPEAPFVVIGPGVNAGQAFGQTGKMMEALPISLKTGRLDRSNGTKINLEDVGATLLAASAIDPEPYGYAGRVLNFLI